MSLQGGETVAGVEGGQAGNRGRAAWKKKWGGLCSVPITDHGHIFPGRILLVVVAGHWLYPVSRAGGFPGEGSRMMPWSWCWILPGVL